MHPALAPLIERVRAAHASAAPLRIRGGGTKDFYGCPVQAAPSHGPLQVLSTRALAGIVSYEPSELVITALAGTPLQTIEAALAERGQCLAFEPPRFVAQAAPVCGQHSWPVSEASQVSDQGGATQPLGGAAASNDLPPPAPAAFGACGATLGGMVSAGLSGPARVSAGAVRDYVLGVQMLNGRGELLRFGGQVMKNVAGYDVSRLMVGALGTLGVLVEVSLKVLPVAPAEVTLVFDCDEAQARQRLNRWAGQPLPLSASCWEGGRLLVRLRGAHAAVAAAQRAMGGDAAHEHEAGMGAALPAAHADVAATARLFGAGAAAQWQLLRDQTHPFFVCQPGQALWRVAVPDTAPNLNLGATLVEWHGAQRWLRAPAGDAARIRAAAAQAGGHATVFRPAALAMAAPTPCEAPVDDDALPTASAAPSVAVFSPLPEPLARIHRALKAEFDPAGIFNPGRLGVV